MKGLGEGQGYYMEKYGDCFDFMRNMKFNYFKRRCEVMKFNRYKD